MHAIIRFASPVAQAGGPSHIFPKLEILHKLWGGPPERADEGSAADQGSAQQLMQMFGSGKKYGH
jgi:hypothetical protein